MIKIIDNLLNRITMYRLMLYYLIVLLLAAALFGFFGILPYTPMAVLMSTLAITATCWIVNRIFAYVFKAPTNVESVYITALILALIITPPGRATDVSILSLIFWASIWAMASKFIFAIRKKHVFNPAAFGVALTALTINQSASWWVGNIYMLPIVVVGGLLVVRKIKRFDLVISFLCTAYLTIMGITVLGGGNAATILQQITFDTAIFFFAGVMLTEPLTTPPTRQLRIAYGAAVGFLFAPMMHIGSLYSTPELALLAGNIFSYLVSPKEKLMLRLKEKNKLSSDIYEFVFESDQKLNFKAGQYLEWTLAHEDPDTRGNRRYFTIASAPTEKEIRVGIKFQEPTSSFKQTLLTMKPGDSIIASQLAGEFVLPKNKNNKVVFIAGGIGVTPFRSMVKYLTDTHESRSVVLLYSVKTPDELVYRDVFDNAKDNGVKTIYNVSEKESVTPSWQGHVGRLDSEVIKKEVPDYKDRIFYLSGPHAMVTAFEESLKNMGIRREHIKTDFFPGFV